MNIVYRSRLNRHWILATSLGSLLGFVPFCYAERVGFTFGGALIPNGPPAMIKLFGVSVSNNSLFDGAFSYDVPSNGIPGSEPRELDFAQHVPGGFTLNIGSGIHLSATDFTIQVIDNYQIDTGVFVDTFGVVFSRTASAGPTLLLNGNPYLKAANIGVHLDWPSETFSDPDEPKLMVDRPGLFPNERGSFGFISAGGGASVGVSVVDPISVNPLDYNRDGRLNWSDFDVWRLAFNEPYEMAPYADGNLDHVIDAGDYVVWRHAFDNGASLSNSVQLPEPPIVVPLSLFVAACAATRTRFLGGCAPRLLMA